MSTPTATKQYLDIQREQIRITETLNLLRRFYRECTKQYTRVLTTEYLKEKSLPHQLMSVIQDKKIVFVKGTGAGKTYLWNSTFPLPTEELADQCWREAIKIRAEYETMKLRERRGERPNTVRVGQKQFIRLLKPTTDTPSSVLKRQPTTVTEVNVMKKLKIVKMFLTTGQHVMDFASLCLHHGISTKWEKTMLKTVVGRTHKGFEWIESDDIDYEMVRKVIDTSKTITDVELDIPTAIIRPTQEPDYFKQEKPAPKEIKSEFEKVLETKTAEIKKVEDENSRSNQRLFRLFSLLQELYKVLNYDVIRSVSSFCRKHNIPESMVKILKDAKIISKTELGYNWIGSEPSKSMTEQLNDSYNKKYNVYSKPKVATNDKVTFTKNKKEMTPKQMGNVLVEFLTDHKDEKKKQIMKLAEKFTKAGNYEMAEQLLDQVI